MSALDTSKMSKGKADAMEVAEESRQTTWEHPSFAGELFMGRFRDELVSPYPVQGDDDRRVGDDLLARLQAFLAKEVDAEAIDRAQILMIPGGFSAGDEPDGSGKFIAAAYRNPRVRDAVHRLLKDRDGLVLGICNGFQALIKLGLVPYGEIRALGPGSPTLTFNNLRYTSRFAWTRVVSNRSPWLAGLAPGALHNAAIAHGEGRIVGPEAALRALLAQGQVATQYVDEAGQPTLDLEFNPNGSALAIEGLTSPDGRVLGKMAHPERFTPHTWFNVPGEKDMEIFRAGVEYFR